MHKLSKSDQQLRSSAGISIFNWHAWLERRLLLHQRSESKPRQDTPHDDHHTLPCLPQQPPHAALPAATVTTRCLACHNSHASLCFACSAWLPLASDTLCCCSCRVCRSEEAGREEGGQESAVVGCCYLRKCFQTVLWYREVNPSNTRRRGSKRCSRRRYAAASRPQCCRTRAFAPLFLKSGPVIPPAFV